MTTDTTLTDTPLAETATDTLNEHALTDDPRTEARMCAVQAVFQWRCEDEAPEQVIAQFNREHVKLREAQEDLFNTLVNAVRQDEERFLQILESHLRDGWTLVKLDQTMVALMLVGIAELSACPETPTAVVLEEFITLAHAFFDPKHVKFVHGVLHAVGEKVR